MDSRWKTFGLLLVGLALLLNPVVPGVHLGPGTVYRYEAASVNYTAGEGLELRYVETGQRLEPVAVDDQIICEDDEDRRLCGFERFVERNGSVPARGDDSRYALVYLDGRFHRPTAVEHGNESYLSLDRVNGSDPLREVAATDLSPTERRVVKAGEVVTYRDLQRKDQLLRVGGEYFVVRQTARKRYTRGRDNCRGTDEGLCNAADWKRRTDTALTVGSWLVGFALVLHGWARIRT